MLRLTYALALTALLAAPLTAQQPVKVAVPAGTPHHFGWVIEGTIEAGGEELFTVVFTDGDEQTVHAGQGGTISFGAELRPRRMPNLGVRGMIGYKFVTTAAENANITFTRIPVEVVASYYLQNDFAAARTAAQKLIAGATPKPTEQMLQIQLRTNVELNDRAGTLKSLERTYRFHLEPRQKIVLAGGETAATIGAAAARTNGINTAMVYGTDGGIVAADLVLLEDDGRDQPIYAPVPTIRGEVLRAHPRIAAIVRPLMEGLDVETLQRLNARVQIDGESPEAVAADHLHDTGLLPRSQQR